jgi:hypothetical protein
MVNTLVKLPKNKKIHSYNEWILLYNSHMEKLRFYNIKRLNQQ